MNDYIISHIRTYTPLLVGALIALLASRNITLDPKAADAAVVLLTALFSASYYALVRLFEANVNARFGWLLGFAKQPSFNAANPSGR